MTARRRVEENRGDKEEDVLHSGHVIWKHILTDLFGYAFEKMLRGKVEIESLDI